MNTIEKIKKPVTNELIKFNKVFSASMKSKIPLLDIVTNYLLRRKGKQIRPLLIFLCAKLLGKPGDSTFTAASLAEMLHNATLIHDDIVDESYERRGFLSINAIWKSKIAVLLGDFLLSRGLILAVEKKEYDILGIFTAAVKEMSEGELYQIQKARKLNIREDEYFEIIRKKTATLLAACTASGARSVTRNENTINEMNELGINIGMAFQIKDDLFDYEQTSLTGKPKWNDIQEKKLTLPLIAALEKVNNSERKEIIRLINKKSKKTKTYQKIFDFVHAKSGPDYARSKMYHYRDEAIKILNNYPASEARDSLELLVNYIVERKK
jgi:octaprenyl-diphosphate synthase